MEKTFDVVFTITELSGIEVGDLVVNLTTGINDCWHGIITIEGHNPHEWENLK